MRKRNILSLARAILLSSMFGMSMALPAMPTAEEIAAAEPLVQEVMKAEMDALRSGKKTREQVGDAAVALAKAAQAPAEKYILLTGAFDYYMRGGAYDKAASALEAVRKAVPDWKGSDEFALIDKAMRVVAFGKGGPVRERYEELKERQQYASRLKKALAQAKAKPFDKKLQFQVATYSAALDRWPQAVDAFLAANNPACAAAAKLEKESAPPAKIADAWWSVVDIRPAFLSSAIRAHAVDLYKKALASNSLAGLQRVAAEKRIAEVESAAEPEKEFQSVSRRSSAAESAKFTGVKLVGNTVKLNKGVLSEFTGPSCALIEPDFSPGNAPIEAVIEFTMPDAPVANAGLMGGLGGRDGFTPFYIVGSSLVGYLSTSGKSWDLASALKLGLPLKPKDTYRVKCEWNGKEYIWSVWRGNWVVLGRLACQSPVAGGLKLQLGTNRGSNSPFLGAIDLNKSYIKVGGKLWWEGVKGAYKNANK